MFANQRKCKLCLFTTILVQTCLQLQMQIQLDQSLFLLSWTEQEDRAYVIVVRIEYTDVKFLMEFVRLTAKLYLVFFFNACCTFITDAPE